MNGTSNYPRLCGGTFFTLLLEAANQKLKERKKFGDNNNFNEPDVFEAIVNMALIGCSRSDDNDNYKSVVGAYKSCNTKKSGRIPISEQANISTFDSTVKNNYPVALVAMNAFVENYINAEGKGVWLVKALLELIAVDTNTDGAEFYITQDGLPIKKAALGGIDEFCLPAFLLGVWHYIVKNVPDNSVGRATYEEWCKPGKSKNTREDFKSDVGESLSGQKIVIVPYIGILDAIEGGDTIHNEGTTETSDGQSAEQGEPYVKIEADKPKYSAEQQVIIEGNLYFQRGEKSKQFFGNVENVYD